MVELWHVLASGVKCSTSIVKCSQAESDFNNLLYKIANVSLKLVAIDASRFGLWVAVLGSRTMDVDTKRNVPDAPPCSYHRGGGTSVASLCSDTRSLLLVINLI